MMDSPDLDSALHGRALQGLARINSLSLVTRCIWKELGTLPSPSNRSIRILDVACGGGDVAISLKILADRAGVPLEIQGCDLNSVAVAFASERARRLDVDVEFFQHDATAGNLPSGYDLVYSSLFLHHLSDEEAPVLLSNMGRAGRAVVVQDLLRTRLGYLMATTAVKLLTRSRVVWTDGPRSVRAAFSLREMQAMCRRAGLRNPTLSRCWPERFSLRWGGER
jgi:2-polyprenyl-3-methyl-5-hydroxy-6-metoxy-1,4-benzoquinol methylase